MNDDYFQIILYLCLWYWDWCCPSFDLLGLISSYHIIVILISWWLDIALICIAFRFSHFRSLFGLVVAVENDHQLNLDDDSDLLIIMHCIQFGYWIDNLFNYLNDIALTTHFLIGWEKPVQASFCFITISIK